MRGDKEAVLDMLFAAFEKHQYYNIRDLVKITRQPVVSSFPQKFTIGLEIFFSIFYFLKTTIKKNVSLGVPERNIKRSM